MGGGRASAGGRVGARASRSSQASRAPVARSNRARPAAAGGVPCSEGGNGLRVRTLGALRGARGRRSLNHAVRRLQPDSIASAAPPLAWRRVRVGNLAFFPWLILEKDFDFDDFQLLGYRRGATPGRDADEQAAIDRVLSAYRDSSGKPVNRATVMCHAFQGTPTATIDESLHADFFVFADLVAFAGLAGRRFFSHSGYCNRDSYRLVLQAFTDPGRGVLVTTRRRDGQTNTFFSGGSYVVYRPHHVGFDRTGLDHELLAALLRARSHDQWPRLFQSIVLFNAANTDRPEMPVGTELILTYASLEQALDMAGRSPAEVAERFAELVLPSEPVPRARWRVAESSQGAHRLLDRARSLRHAWLQDLGVARGSVAHGHAVEAYPACWRPHEHLLIGAHVVPLVVKLQLHSLRLYKLTESDATGIDVIEPLLNEDHFGIDSEDDDGVAEAEKHPWIRITSRERMRMLARRIADDFLDRMDPAL